MLKRSPSRRPAAILALLLTAAAGSAASDVNVGAGDFSFGVVSGRATDEVSRKYQVPAAGRFEVVNVNGMIQVEQAAGAEVEVRAERTAKAATDEAAKELLGKVEIAETRSGDQVKIETKAPKNFGRGGVEVKYYIKVPAGLKVAAQTTNGGVRLVGISNEVVAATTNGGVSGENLTGSVNASTTNGGIELSVGAIGAQGVKAETVNGGVAVTVPRNAKADISARVVNGGLSVGDLPVETVGEQSRRRLEGKLNGGGPRIEIGAVNGGVRLSGQ